MVDTALDAIEQRVVNYWSQRSADFQKARRQELEGETGARWLHEIEKYLPEGRTLHILDVGCGVGFFTILLAEQGHRVCGIDLTPAMLEKAEELLEDRHHTHLDKVEFKIMDAQNLEFEDHVFDVVIARNVVWTLPHPEKAYMEWKRVLKPGGVMLNFGADYAREVRSQEEKGGCHPGLTPEQNRESNEITLSMPLGSCERPEWDMEAIERLGYVDCMCDRNAGKRLMGEKNGKAAPMFLIYGRA